MSFTYFHPEDAHRLAGEHLERLRQEAAVARTRRRLGRPPAAAPPDTPDQDYDRGARDADDRRGVARTRIGVP